VQGQERGAIRHFALFRIGFDRMPGTDQGPDTVGTSAVSLGKTQDRTGMPSLVTARAEITAYARQPGSPEHHA
jgi:hypothetical protein